MPGFLGGSTGSSGTGGEITFPKEFIDPVTKLRVSQPENLIDTDFEYGLQPTKWETVELINNTPSFFSKSGDTTIPGIVSITTNNGTREITVTTALEHGQAPGIPINVTGTKSVTADGAYIINSVPNLNTFTYLCRDTQDGDNSIEDLYTSIITGEFFQGSQLRISDAEGIITDGEAVSTLTVKTDSTHGFGVNTPFYFLNLNSTISQEFEAANTAGKSFDSSNSATAQTFDGSNTLASTNIDWSNSATIAGTVSPIGGVGVNVTNDTITVTHTTENFVGRLVGTPLYYNVTTSAGYFADNPRGVVFLKELVSSSTTTSTFTVSAVPDGEVIDLTASMSGTFQLANQARTFAGNNTNPATETTITVINDEAKNVDAVTSTSVAGADGTVCTVTSYSAGLITTTVDAAGVILDFYTGAMVVYTTTGAAATGLTNNRTYFIDSFNRSGTSDTYIFTLKELPNSPSAITSISGGTGTQKFTRIGISPDKDVFHVRNNGYVAGDMLRYTFPEGGSRFTTTDVADQKEYYFVETVYDVHNFTLGTTLGLFATGGTITTAVEGGVTYNVHTFPTIGSATFEVTSGSTTTAEVLIVAGGGGGGTRHAGGGGGGGVIYRNNITLTAGSYAINVGAGGAGGAGGPCQAGDCGRQGIRGSNSTFVGGIYNLVALGGGGGSANEGASQIDGGSAGGSTSNEFQNTASLGNIGTATQPTSASGGFGSRGSSGCVGNAAGAQGYSGGGGGGAGGISTVAAIGYNVSCRGGNGGPGYSSNINGTTTLYAGGGGGSGCFGAAGDSQGGTGNTGAIGTGSNARGGAATAFGGGGGAGGFGNGQQSPEHIGGGAGRQGIVIVRYRR
jgi:hypothetical protein